MSSGWLGKIVVVVVAVVVVAAVAGIVRTKTLRDQLKHTLTTPPERNINRKNAIYGHNRRSCV